MKPHVLGNLKRRLLVLTRPPWIYVWRGFPVILVFGASAWIMLQVAVTEKNVSAKIRQARTALKDATDKKLSDADRKSALEQATLRWKRIIQDNGETNEHLFGFAQTLLAGNQTDWAQAILAKLAPLEGETPGYGPARLMVAQWLVRSKADENPLANENRLRAAVMQLNKAIEADSGNTDARILLGEIYVSQGKIDEAISQFTAAVSDRPELGSALYQLYEAKNDPDNSRKWGEVAVKHYRQLAEADAANHFARMRWGFLESALGRFENAVAILGTGLTNAAGNVELATDYRRLTAMIYVSWIVDMTKNQPNDLNRRIELLETGLDLDPSNGELLKILVAMTHGTGPQTAQLRDKLQSMVASGKISAELHFALAIDAWFQNRPAEAQIHFERALKLSPQKTPILANNLAFTLAFADPPDLDRALELIQSALKESPNIPAFLDTRGLILLKRKDYQGAVTDLEYALQKLGRSQERHLALAEAYEHLGSADFAKKHRELALTAPRSPGDSPGANLTKKPATPKASATPPETPPATPPATPKSPSPPPAPVRTPAPAPTPKAGTGTGSARTPSAKSATTSKAAPKTP